MNLPGSIFFERLVAMRENNNNNFVMSRNFNNRSYPFILQLRITRIKMVRNYTILFRQWLENQIAHITKDYDFSWGPEDTRSRRAIDTIGYLVCRFNKHKLELIKKLDGAFFDDKFLACNPNAFCDYERQYNNYLYVDLDINRLDTARPDA